jgi:hypothetical protein
VQGTCVFGTGCRGARLLVWLILNDRVRPSSYSVCALLQIHSPPCKIHTAYVWRILQGGGCLLQIHSPPCTNRHICTRKCTVHILCLYGDTVHLCLLQIHSPPCTNRHMYTVWNLTGRGDCNPFKTGCVPLNYIPCTPDHPPTIAGVRALPTHSPGAAATPRSRSGTGWRVPASERASV